MRIGNVRPKALANRWLSRALSWETPQMAASCGRSCWYRRSTNGSAYWQVGHETLKKAASTGLRSSAAASEYGLPSTSISSNGGAAFPGAIADIGESSGDYSSKGERADATDPKGLGNGSPGGEEKAKIGRIVAKCLILGPKRPSSCKKRHLSR